eukprot:UN21512
MTHVTQEINRALGRYSGDNGSVLFHYSGHGGILLKKLGWGQVLVGTDGKRNGKGCKILQSNDESYQYYKSSR